jgi:hypothetical protein
MIKIIEINWNDTKSIKQAEKKKTMYENKGYTLLKHVCGMNDIDKMHYQTK